MERPSGSVQDPNDIVPSSQQYKQIGWDNLARAIHSVIAVKGRGSLAALEEIHRLVTPEVESPLKHPGHRQTYINGIWTHDRPDGEELYRRFQELYGDRYINAQLQARQPIPLVIMNTITMLRTVAEHYSQTSVSLNPGVSGVLRNFGSREIAGFPKEPFVYAAHQTYMGTDAEHAEYVASPYFQWPPAHYFGLSAGLDTVYQKLGETYDGLKTDTQEQRFQKEAFFSLVGTKLIHPFLDATGRAFGGFTAVSLHEMGINLAGSQVQEMNARLNFVSSHMLLEFLRNAGLGVLQGRQHLDVEVNHPFRQDYMTKLRVGLIEAIKAGIDSEGPYFPYIQGGSQVIKAIAQSNRR